jgi:molybdate transport system substrate-binding protein
MKWLISLIVLILASPGLSQAADIKLASVGLFRGSMPDLMKAFEGASGHKVNVTIATPRVIKDKLLKGEEFDVAFLPTNLDLAELIKAGKVIVASRKDIGRTSLGVATRDNGAKPDLNSPEAVKNAVIGAKIVALSNEAPFLQKIADKFGFGPELKSRAKIIGAGGRAVAEAVAKGDADLGITLASEIAVVPGVELAGLLPPEMQLVISGYGVLITGTKEPDAAKALLDFMTSPTAKKIMRQKGVEPL